MNKQKYRISLPLALLALCVLIILAGCNTSTAEPAESTAEPVPDVVLPLEGENAYMIIRPENASKDELSLVTELRKLIEDKTGVNVTIRDDFVREGTKFTLGDCEICFGLTGETPETPLKRRMLSQSWR